MTSFHGTHPVTGRENGMLWGPFERVLARIGAVALILTLSAGAAAAANCGGNNQRACKLWERVPSCDRGLSEVSRPGFCTKPPRVPGVVGAFKCGAKGQRPCSVAERIPSCDRGLVEDFIRNQCVKKATGPKEIAQACYKNFETVTKAVAPAAKCIAGLGNLRQIIQAFKRKDVNGVTNALLKGACKGQVQQAARAMRQNGFASMSLGISGEVGTGLGPIGEFSVAIDTNLRGRPYLYETLGYRVGFVAGGSLNGVLTAHRSSASSLAGDGQAVSLSLKALKGAGISVGLSYANGKQTPNCVSTSVSAGLGAEANAGSLNRFMTIKLY